MKDQDKPTELLLKALHAYNASTAPIDVALFVIKRNAEEIDWKVVVSDGCFIDFLIFLSHGKIDSVLSYHAHRKLDKLFEDSYLLEVSVKAGLLRRLYRFLSTNPKLDNVFVGISLHGMAFEESDEIVYSLRKYLLPEKWYGLFYNSHFEILKLELVIKRLINFHDQGKPIHTRS
jgi:hypothetical protein